MFTLKITKKNYCKTIYCCAQNLTNLDYLYIEGMDFKIDIEDTGSNLWCQENEQSF